MVILCPAERHCELGRAAPPPPCAPSQMVAGCTEPSARPAPKEIGECQIQKVARRGAPARPMFRDSLRCSSAFSSAWRSMDATTTGWRWVRVRGDNIAGNLRRGRGDHRSEQANGQANPFKPRCAGGFLRETLWLPPSARIVRSRWPGEPAAAERQSLGAGGGGRPRGTTCRPRRASGSTQLRPFPSPGSTGVSTWCVRARARALACEARARGGTLPRAGGFALAGAPVPAPGRGASGLPVCVKQCARERAFSWWKVRLRPRAL